MTCILLWPHKWDSRQLLPWDGTLVAEKYAIIFDDDELFRILFSRILKGKKFQVKSQANPCDYFCLQSGVDACPVATPCAEVLLTDQKMPDMTGLELLRRLQRMQCKIPDSRKAIISGDWTEEEFEEARQTGSYVFHKSEAKEQISIWVESLNF